MEKQERGDAVKVCLFVEVVHCGSLHTAHRKMHNIFGHFHTHIPGGVYGVFKGECSQGRKDRYFCAFSHSLDVLLFGSVDTNSEGNQVIQVTMI